MRREVGSGLVNPMEEGLIFHAPLTSNSIDIVGGKSSIGDAVSYSANGAYFDDSSSDKLKYLCYELSERELKSIKTIYCEVCPTSSKYETQTVYYLGTVLWNPYVDYDGVGGEGANRQYRSIWHHYDCLTCKYSSKNPPESKWHIDFDGVSNTIINQNTWYKLIGCTYSNQQFTYVNGAKNYSASNTDHFDELDTTLSPQTGHCYLTIGGRILRYEKQLKGYVRNVMMWTREFTDAELAAMTSF